MIEITNELLTTRAHEWDVKSNQDISTELIQKMDEVYAANKDKIIVTAQEVGHLERAVSVKFADDVHTFMNPILKETGRVKLCREVDLLDGKEYIVPRFSTLSLIFQDCLGSIKMMALKDAAAMVIHQAVDALDGVYPGDIGLEVIPEFDSASPEEQQEVLTEFFTKVFPKRYEELNSDLSLNEDTKDKWDALKFMSAKARGEIKEDDTPKLSNRKKKFIEKLSKQILANKNKMKFWRKK